MKRIPFAREDGFILKAIELDKYRFVTRAVATTIQVLGLTFFGGEFFSPALVQRK